MRVLVCGDRNWTDKDTIEAYIKTLPPESVVIQGMCRGADWIARTLALLHGYEIEDYPAKWELYGRSAGPRRNAQMLREGKPDLVVAFHNNLTKSRGTKNMMEQANRIGIESVLHRSGDFK